MREYLKRVLELVKPYRFRFALGLLCGFFSGALAFTLPLSLTLALNAVFPEKKSGSSLFAAGEIKEPLALAQKLTRPQDALSARIGGEADAAARAIFVKAQGTNLDSEALETALVRSLNRVILGPPLYQTNLVAESNLRPETRTLLAENPQGEDLVRLNRLVVEDGYPQNFPKKGRRRQNLQFLPAPARKLVETVGGWFDTTEHASKSRVVFAIALIPGAMLIRGILGYLNIYMLSWVGIKAANDLKVRLFSHLMQMPLGFFNRMSTGDLMARTEGAMAVNNTINGAFVTIIREPITLVVLVVTLIAMQPLLSLVTLVVFPVCLVPVIIYGRKLRKSHHGIHEKFASSNNVLHESFTGIRVIKAYNLESRMVERFSKATEAVRGYFMRSVRASEAPGPLIEFIGSIGVAFIFVYFAFLTQSRNQGNLVAFFAAVFNLYAPLKNLSRLQSQLTLARVGVAPIYEMLGTHTTLPELAQPKPLRAHAAPIKFENVSFSYGEKPVLHDINLTIQPGQLVALVGRTGSGKTSLANLLLRFYDPQKGAVLIGDTDIREVSSRDLRANIAVVAQETILFNDNIHNNIAVGRLDATREQIKEAAKHAYAHDFIKEKKWAYDTPVGEKGVNVSGGQRQRIAIARAILRDAPILILDEATNALDPEAERIVQAALEKLMEGRTTICIAHRLSTIQRADLIVVLDSGRIVETGTHAELLRNGGLYSKLHELAFETVSA